MVGSVGMAAAYGGYQQARKADNEIASGDIQLENAKLDQEAVKALGNAVPLLQQMMMPGAQAMPQGGGAPPQQMAQAPQAAPQPPAPGQPSQPMTRGPAPQMLGGPAPPSDPTMSIRPDVPPGSVGDRFGGLPGGGAPPAPPMSQQPQAPQGAPPAGVPQRGAVAQPPQGTMNLHTVMGAVVKANPGASPQVIAMALAKALPLMTAQSQMDYKQLMTQLAGGKLQEAVAHNVANEGIGGRRVDATNTRTEAGVTNTNTRVDAQRDISADRIGSREKIEADKEGGRNTRADAAETGRAERFAKRSEFLSQRIELQSKSLDRAIARDKVLADNAENRRTLKLMEDENNIEFKRTQQKIQAASGMANPMQKTQLMKEAEDTYNNTKMRVEGYKRQMDGGKAGSGSETPPIESLKEGQTTTFTNGQKWTLQGGKPVKVP